MKLLRRLRPGSRTTTVLAAAAVLAVGISAVATGATGDVIRAGKRTFGGSQTTQIVSETGGFATRQSNGRNGDGGAASYGCRADSGREPCLYVLNHSTSGRVFQFEGNGGSPAGRIDVKPPSGKTAADVAPFYTNATGVAQGLNADRVDGQSAADIVAASQPKFAAVNADGTVSGNRGLAQANAVVRSGAGNYTVTFATDVSKCALQATETTATNAGAVAAAPITNSVNAVQVITRAGGGADGNGPTDPADRPFHLVVSC
jgi:hypothetical protein